MSCAVSVLSHLSAFTDHCRSPGCVGVASRFHSALFRSDVLFMLFIRERGCPARWAACRVPRLTRPNLAVAMGTAWDYRSGPREGFAYFAWWIRLPSSNTDNVLYRGNSNDTADAVALDSRNAPAFSSQYKRRRRQNLPLASLSFGLINRAARSQAWSKQQ